MLHLKDTDHHLTCLYGPKAEAQVYFQSIRNLAVEGAGPDRGVSATIWSFMP